jgi:hypothetical protein
MNKVKVVFYGPVSSMSGYGSCSRSIIKSLIENYKDKWDIKIIPCGWGNLPTDFIDNNIEWKWLEEYFINGQLTYQPDIMITHSIPTEFFKIGRKNVGITAGIETTICAPQWIEHINQMDLTIVPSQHAKHVFETSKFQKQDQNTKQVVGEIKLEKPIEVVFEGFDSNIYKYLDKLEITSLVKQELDQIPEQFCYLSVGNWTPGQFLEERKNISGLIKVFLETFKNKSKKPALILKTHIGSSSIPDREELLKRIDQIKDTINSKDLPNIYLIHGDLTDQEMNELYNHPKVKAMVSLTKGEGFGRPLLEFTQSKKPIMASGWSGHIDFLNKEFTTLLPGNLTPIHSSAQVKDMLIEGSQWFSVDLGIVGGYMKDCFENYSKYKDNGKRLGYYCKENFTFEKMKELQKQVIDKYSLEPYSIKLPKLSKIK